MFPPVPGKFIARCLQRLTIKTCFHHHGSLCAVSQLLIKARVWCSYSTTQSHFLPKWWMAVTSPFFHFGFPFLSEPPIFRPIDIDYGCNSILWGAWPINVMLVWALHGTFWLAYSKILVRLWYHMYFTLTNVIQCRYALLQQVHWSQQCPSWGSPWTLLKDVTL